MSIQPASVLTLPTAEQTGLPEQAVSSANHAVKSALEREANGRRKWRYTMTFTVEDHAKIVKCAVDNGVAVAQKHFKEPNLSESTVCYFRKKYLTELSKRVKADLSEVTKLDVAKSGRKVTLGEILHLRENGAAVSISLVQAAAEDYSSNFWTL